MDHKYRININSSFIELKQIVHQGYLLWSRSACINNYIMFG